MSTYRLKNLLSPRSLALIGASPRQGSVGRAILGNIRKAGFQGDFGLVNSHYPEIDGTPAVGSVAKLAFAPELVVITAPAKAVAGLIDEAGRCNVTGAVIVSAGLGHGRGSLANAAEHAAK
jgi:acetyltransferase